MDPIIKEFFEACRHEEWNSNSGTFAQEVGRLMRTGADPLACQGHLPFDIQILDAPSASPLNFALLQGLGGSDGLPILVAAGHGRMGIKELADAAVCLEAGRLLCMASTYATLPSFRRGSNGFALWRKNLKADAAWHAYGALRAFDQASMPLVFDADVIRRAASLAETFTDNLPLATMDARPAGTAAAGLSFIQAAHRYMLSDMDHDAPTKTLAQDCLNQLAATSNPSLPWGMIAVAKTFIEWGAKAHGHDESLDLAGVAEERGVLTLAAFLRTERKREQISELQASLPSAPSQKKPSL